MGIKSFHKDKIAVSPVIAIILMVAITVVLASVLYVWVMELANNRGTQAEFPVVKIDLKTDSAGYNYLAITHESGETIKWSKYQINIIDKSKSSNRVTLVGLTGELSFGNMIIFTDNSNYTDGTELPPLAGITLNVGNQYSVEIYETSEQQKVLEKEIICSFLE